MIYKPKMKYILILFLVTFILSCTSEEKPSIRNSIESYVLKNINDPESYEFVEMQVDTIFMIDYYTEKRNSFISEEMNLSAYSNEEAYKEYQKEEKRKTDSVNKYNELIKKINPKSIKGFKVNFKHRSNNSLGNKSIDVNKFNLDKDYKLIN